MWSTVKLGLRFRLAACPAFFLLAGSALLQVGCGNATPPGSSACAPASSSALSASSPLSIQVQHAFIVVLENHAYDEVIGNTSDLPYLNSLARTYAYSQGYFADTHPSIGNYFMLTTGQVISNDDSFSNTVSDDNIVRHLVSAGKTWKEYSEDLPSVGYTGGDTGGYIQHHNPLSYFSDVRGNTAQANNLVPFTQLATDLAAHQLPNYAFLVPNNQDNAHDCPNGGTSCTTSQKLAAADHWLQTNIAPLLASSDFSAPGGGILVITFDESYESDTTAGGGHVAWVVAGPDIKRGYASTTCYQHESTFRFMSEGIGLGSFPGSAAAAPDMREFLSGE